MKESISYKEALVENWKGENNGKECRCKMQSANGKYVSGQECLTKVRAGASIEVG